MKTTDPITLELRTPIDHAILKRISHLTQRGSDVICHVAVSDDEAIIDRTARKKVVKAASDENLYSYIDWLKVHGRCRLIRPSS